MIYPVTRCYLFIRAWKVRQKQLVVDQLQYELTTQGRRATDELGALKQRVTELELQLVQTRREADEYFKSGLERNAEATSLGNQVTTDNGICPVYA